jgi:hypothetical protein
MDFSVDLILPALGSTRPVTEMSTRNLPGGKGLPARKAHILIAISEPVTGIAVPSCHVKSQMHFTNA